MITLHGYYRSSAAYRVRIALNLKDVAQENPEVVERLSQQLEQWHEQALAARLPSDDEATSSMSVEELERLRSLGYIR